MKETLKFPDGFYWGAATSAHQVEGGNHNDWSEWEKSGKRLTELKKRGEDPANFISGKACDSYNRHEEDFDIAKSLGHNMHRISIEWSRIEPEEGRFNYDEVEHYKKVIDAIRTRGMEPMVTLWHFTNPIWFAEKGGWLNKKAPEYFARYVQVMGSALKDRVEYWATFNEATHKYVKDTYIDGTWPPGYRNIFKAWKFINNIIASHTLAYRLLKKIYSSSTIESWDPGHTSHNVKVGIVENNRDFDGISLLKKVLDYFTNNRTFKKTSPHLDFIGLNYYRLIRLPGNKIKMHEKSENGWELYPEGLYNRLMYLKSLNKPIFITENGIADSKDNKRVEFLREHLFWIWKAIQDGADVRSYLYWSLLDNFEWDAGFGPRFGLVAIDYATQKREIRPSAFEYARICKTNSLDYQE